MLADEDKEQNADRWYSPTLVQPGICPNRGPMDAGIFDENWGNSSLQQSCAPPNLLQPLRLGLHLLKSLRLRSSMALRNSHAPPLPMAFPAPRLPLNLMERCVALPTIPSIHRNGALSAMAPYGSCMRLALVIVAPVLCVPSVKRAVTRSSLGE